MKYEPKLIVDSKSLLGEGLFWDTETKLLYWLDILNCKFHIYNPKDSSNQTHTFNEYIGCIIPRTKGGFVAAFESGFYFYDSVTHKLEFLCQPEKDKENNRYNDGACDPYGRFWAGTMSNGENDGNGSGIAEGRLYCLDTDLTAKEKINDIVISNGIAWNSTKDTMYYIDSPTQKIDAFDYDISTGEITNRRSIIDFPGFPDGMCIDSQGMLWIAHWGGYSVKRYNPNNGNLIDQIDLPVKCVSNCVFGGEDLTDLYITTSTMGMPPSDPNYKYSGGLFKVKTSVKGTPLYKFNG